MLKVSKNLPIVQNVIFDFIPESLLKKQTSDSKNEIERFEMVLKMAAKDGMKVYREIL